MQITVDLDHLAFAILHSGFCREGLGGCSCETCGVIRRRMDEIASEEAMKWYDEHYPPPGGLL